MVDSGCEVGQWSDWSECDKPCGAYRRELMQDVVDICVGLGVRFPAGPTVIPTKGGPDDRATRLGHQPGPRS